MMSSVSSLFCEVELVVMVTVVSAGASADSVEDSVLVDCEFCVDVVVDGASALSEESAEVSEL